MVFADIVGGVESAGEPDDNLFVHSDNRFSLLCTPAYPIISFKDSAPGKSVQNSHPARWLIILDHQIRLSNITEGALKPTL
jgi:hypothetical protein